MVGSTKDLCPRLCVASATTTAGSPGSLRPFVSLARAVPPLSLPWGRLRSLESLRRPAQRRRRGSDIRRSNRRARRQRDTSTTTLKNLPSLSVRPPTTMCVPLMIVPF